MQEEHVIPFDEVEPALREDWESTLVGRRHPWDEVRHDARFGYEQALDPEFEGATFEDVDTELQRRWENRPPHATFEDWRVYREIVKLGFDRAKEELEEKAA